MSSGRPCAVWVLSVVITTQHSAVKLKTGNLSLQETFHDTKASLASCLLAIAETNFGQDLGVSGPLRTGTEGEMM